MTTTTGFRGVNPELIIKLQDEKDPDTGQFRTAEMIQRLLKEEHGVDVTVDAVRQKARRYRRIKGLGPPPIMGERELPWELPEAAHRDVNGYALHRIARREKALRSGQEVTFHPVELRAIAAFEKFLRRQGDATVVSWDPGGDRRSAGWVIRQAVEREEIRYGCMAVRPFP